MILHLCWICFITLWDRCLSHHHQPQRVLRSAFTEIFTLSLFISAACVTLNFINLLGFPFKLHSSLKHEVYLVSGSGFKLRFYIDRPELHSHVIFYAEDPAGKRNVLLNGQPSITERVVSDCPHFTEVLVTAQQG